MSASPAIPPILTKANGVYPIEFSTGEAYTMMLHEGRTHFAVSGLGTHEFPEECDWLAKWKDAGISINMARLGLIAPSKPDSALKEPFESLAQAALTTSAFPFGFSARRVTIDRTKIRSGAMPFNPGSFPTELNEYRLGFLRRQVIDSLVKTMEAELKGHIESPPQQTAFARLRGLLLKPRFAMWLLLVIAALVAIYESFVGDIF